MTNMPSISDRSAPWRSAGVMLVRACMPNGRTGRRRARAVGQGTPYPNERRQPPLFAGRPRGGGRGQLRPWAVGPEILVAGRLVARGAYARLVLLLPAAPFVFWAGWPRVWTVCAKRQAPVLTTRRRQLLFKRPASSHQPPRIITFRPGRF